MNTQDNQQRLEGKKILFLITQSKYGGAQRYVLDLAKYFKEHNEVLIAVGEEKNQDSVFFQSARSLGIEPIIVSSLIRDLSLVKAYEATLELRTLYAKLKPDIVHINSSMAGAVGSCAAWLLGFDPYAHVPKIVYTAHGFVFNEPLSKKRFLLYRWIEKISAAWKHVIITVSQFDRDSALLQTIAPESKLIVIHNGVDSDEKFAQRFDARTELQIPENAQYVIGAIASHYPVKGLSYLIEAAIILKERGHQSQIFILGDGPEHTRLNALIEQGQMSATVHLLGAIPNATRYIRAFDVLVLPSLKEGLPYTILEAGLAEMPVIASHVGGIPEIITNEESGLLVPPRDPSSIANALEQLMKEPDRAQRYGQKLSQKVRLDFTLANMLNQTDEIYRRLFARSTPVTKTAEPDLRTADSKT